MLRKHYWLDKAALVGSRCEASVSNIMERVWGGEGS